MNYSAPVSVSHDHFAADSLRLEAVTVCVGFDDLLDATLALNTAHVDHFIVVTSHADVATQAVARKHSATCVQTDLFQKNGRHFNKGAAINAGFDYFQYHGWRLHLDSDIALPDNFRRVLFNHTHLEQSCIYGADRLDVIGLDALDAARRQPQHAHACLVDPQPRSLCARYVDPLRGYCPIGFFQLWHARAHKQYPWSLGSAAHDDVMFSAAWPHACRRLLPSVIVQHLCAAPPQWGENWEGQRRQPRVD